MYLIYMNRNIIKKNTINNTSRHIKGFSILEIIIYLALLCIVSVLITSNIISLFKNYNIVKTNQEMEYNAISILDKLTKDTHDAKNIILGQSYFSTTSGAIAFNISSSTDDNASNTVRFYLDNGKIKYDKDGNYIGNLSTNNVNVSKFNIYYINSTTSEAVKVELGLDTSPHLNLKTYSKNFYTTIQLRE